MNASKYFCFLLIGLSLSGLSLNSIFAANTFELLPAGSVATGMSGDGSLVIGSNDGEGFRWTHDTGATNLPGVPGTYTTISVSTDGSRIFGEYHDAGNRYVYVWTALGGLEFSTQVSNVTRASNWQESFNPIAMSGDGLFILTYEGAWNGSLRWEIATGKKDLVGNSDVIVAYPTGISADGSVIVGNGSMGSYRWTKTGGVVHMEYGGVGGVSADGHVIFGSNAAHEAARWTSDDKVVPLGLPSGAHLSFATAASADGSIIAGETFTENPTISYATHPSNPFRWDMDHGSVFIADQLTASGIDLGDFKLGTPVAVSSDGSVIAGNGFDSDGNARAWIAKIDTVFPADAPSPTGTSTPVDRPFVNPDPIASTTHKSTLRIRGIVRGNVSSVTYRVEPSKKSGSATGTSFWQLTARLKAGRNVVTIVAHGLGGDSVPEKIVVFRK